MFSEAYTPQIAIRRGGLRVRASVSERRF